MIDRLIYTYGSISCKDQSKIFNNKLKYNVITVLRYTILRLLCFLPDFLMMSISCLFECELSSY